MNEEKLNEIEHFIKELLNPKTKNRQLNDEMKEIIQEAATPQPVAEELYDYFALNGSWATIPNRLLIDEEESYKRYGHPLWLYVEFLDIKIKNPHAYYGCFYLPITIEKHPQIVGDISHLNINLQKINNVKRFISANVKWFQDIANQKKRWYTHKDKLTPLCLLKENKQVLLEMANILKRRSGLPVNIWVDHGHPLQHADRIKFQNDYGNTLNQNNFCTLKIFPPMEVVGKPAIKEYEVERIRTFCKLNQENILLLSKSEIDINEFFHRMKTLDDRGREIIKPNINNSEWTEIPTMKKFGISIVKSNNEKYNYLKDGKLLTKYWFDKAQQFRQHTGNKIIAYAELNGYWFQIEPDGSVYNLSNQ